MVYDAMVKARVAQRLTPSEYYFVDEEGEKLRVRKIALGYKLKLRLPTPNGFCLEMN